MLCWVGNPIDEWMIDIYTDADFAGCLMTHKSTTGSVLKIAGRYTSFVAAAVSKKQTSVSNSTNEAEIVASDYGVRMEGFPALTFWEIPMKRTPLLRHMVDSSSVMRVIQVGRSSSLRHCGRTHKVAWALLHEQHKCKHFMLLHCPGWRQCADISTKIKFTGPEWALQNFLINIFDYPTIEEPGKEEVLVAAPCIVHDQYFNNGLSKLYKYMIKVKNNIF